MRRYAHPAEREYDSILTDRVVSRERDRERNLKIEKGTVDAKVYY